MQKIQGMGGGVIMHFCSIVPSRFIGDLDKTSTWHLVLPHMVRKDVLYKGGYQLLKAKGSTLILDNGYFEMKTNRLSKSDGVTELLEVSDIINPDYICIPDTFYNPQIEEDLDKLIAPMSKHIKKMAVVAANDGLDAIRMFDLLNNRKDIDMIAVPDRLLSINTGLTIAEFLDVVENHVDIKKPVHLFALDNPATLGDLIRPYVNSIDSTAPFLWGLDYRKITNTEVISKRPNDYFDINEVTKSQRQQIEWNINYLKEFCEKQTRLVK